MAKNIFFIFKNLLTGFFSGQWLVCLADLDNVLVNSKILRFFYFGSKKLFLGFMNGFFASILFGLRDAINNRPLQVVGLFTMGYGFGNTINLINNPHYAGNGLFFPRLLIVVGLILFLQKTSLAELKEKSFVIKKLFAIGHNLFS